MRTSIIRAVLLVTLMAVPSIAQKQNPEDFQEYTAEQRWERASNQLTFSFVAAIAYAKTTGQSAKAYGEFLGDLFAPSWGEPGSGSLDVIQGMRMNLLMWPNAEFEITESSETSVTARVNRPWVVAFGDSEEQYGVTPDEFDTTLRTFNKKVADHLGLGYKDRIEGDWLYTTFDLDD